MKINLTEQQIETIANVCNGKERNEINNLLKDFAKEYNISYIVLKRHYDGIVIFYTKRGKPYKTDYSESKLHKKRLEVIITNPSFETLPQAIDVAFDGDLDGKIDIKEIKYDGIRPVVKWSFIIIILSIILSFIFLLF